MDIDELIQRIAVSVYTKGFSTLLDIDELIHGYLASGKLSGFSTLLDIDEAANKKGHREVSFFI